MQHCLAEAHRLSLSELVLSSLPEMTAAHILCPVRAENRVMALISAFASAHGPVGGQN